MARRLAVLGEDKVVNHFNNSDNSELEISEVSEPLDNLEPDPGDTIENFPSVHKCSTPKKETVTSENVVTETPDAAPENKLFTATSTNSPDSVSTQRAAKKRSKGKGNGPAAGVVSPDAQSIWRKSGVVVTTLEGHFDVISSLDTNGSILMSGRLVLSYASYICMHVHLSIPV